MSARPQEIVPRPNVAVANVPPIAVLLGVIIALGGGFLATRGVIVPGVVLVLLGLALPAAMRLANPWERAIVLRLGRYIGTRGNGIFFIIPFIDTVATLIDTRTQTTGFDAEQALSRDKVPVNVDAVLFWNVHNAELAALEVVDYRQAIKQVSQTTLREMIGSSTLEQLLSERAAGDRKLKEAIAEKTQEWGLSVLAVEIRDVGVPQNLQDSLSRQAQAQAEKSARVLLGEAEQEVALKFVEAARIYGSEPAAMQLRAMNIIYETTKERGATILIPTTLVDAMNPVAASAALAAGRAAP